MRKCTLLLLTLFGITFCSLAPTNKPEESGMVNSGVPLIENSTLVVPQDYGSLCSIELWRNLVEFLDFKTEANMALSNKTFYHASKNHKALFLEKVERWMVNGLSLQNKRNKREDKMQIFLVFDKENAFLEVTEDFMLQYYRKLTLSDKKDLTIMQRMAKLKLPCVFLNTFIVEMKMQVPEVKELTLSADFRTNDVIDFWRIQSFFPKVEILQLDLKFGCSTVIPFTADYIFHAMPMLEKLVIRILHFSRPFVSRKELVDFLKILQNEKVKLYFDIIDIFSDESAFVWALDVFNKELEQQDKQFKMKERLFLSVRYMEAIEEKLSKNTMQIHSFSYKPYSFDSLNTTLFTIAKFNRLEKLVLNLPDGKAISELESSFEIATERLMPLSNVAELSLTCNAPRIKVLLSVLLTALPNLTTLRITTSIQFDYWFEALLQLKKLKKLQINNAETTLIASNSFLKEVTNGALPSLREIRMPGLEDEDEADIITDISDEKHGELVYKRPLIKFENMFF